MAPVLSAKHITGHRLGASVYKVDRLTRSLRRLMQNPRGSRPSIAATGQFSAKRIDILLSNHNGVSARQ